MSRGGPDQKLDLTTAELLKRLDLPVSQETERERQVEREITLSHQQNTNHELAQTNFIAPDISRKKDQGLSNSPNYRPLSAEGLSTSHSPSLSRNPSLQTSTETSRSARKRAGTSGLIKNAHFKYQGGVFSKIITFLANLLKMIEKFILALFGGKKAQALPQNKMQQVEPMKTTATTKKKIKR